MVSGDHIFAFDIGTSSIGWAVLGLNSAGKPSSVIDCGVRIFGNTIRGRVPKPASDVRRNMRRASKRRDRFVRRRRALLRALIQIGLLPQSREEYDRLVRKGNDRPGHLGLSPLDPYVLRCRGQRERLEPYEIGRAIMHLAKRRGPKREPSRSGSTHPVFCLTDCRLGGKPVRQRPYADPETGFLPQVPETERQDNEYELQLLWQTQSRFHPKLITRIRGRMIHRIIFFERQRRRMVSGDCSVIPSEKRASRATPLFVEFRILKTLNELRYDVGDSIRHKLTIGQRNRVSRILRRVSFLRFTDLSRVLNISTSAKWSHQGPCRDGIAGTVPDMAYPPNGYCNYGPTALHLLVRHLREAVINESNALKKCNFKEVHYEPSSVSELPPYQKVIRFKPSATDRTRIENNTVHVALNQLRKVCNKLIGRHGIPDRIALESGRYLPAGFWERQSILLNRRNRFRANRDRTLRYRTVLKSIPDVRDSRKHRLKHQIWEQMQSLPGSEMCHSPYTGAPIAMRELFSWQTEIDHLIPLSRTTDRSRANLVITHRRENRQKRDRLPWEIAEWAGWRRVRAKSNRPGEEPVVPGINHSGSAGFPSRQLPEMRLIARYARKYLSVLFNHRSSIVSVPGRLTATLREAWQLNRIIDGSGDRSDVGKRTDHRSHALDAIVIGVAHNLMPRITRRGIFGDLRREPWSGFRKEVASRISGITVSHKQNHGNPRRLTRQQTLGTLHGATAYGATNEISSTGVPLGVWRKPFLDLTPGDVARIRDPALKTVVAEETKGETGAGFRASLLEIACNDPVFQSIKRARLIRPINGVGIRDTNGRIYKRYLGNTNHHVDIWELAEGGYEADVVSMWEAHDPDRFERFRRTNHNARKIMRLHRNDMMAMDDPESRDRRLILRVVKFTRDGRITFADHFAAGRLKTRHENPEDAFRYRTMTASTLKKYGVRKIHVDEIGTVHDAGPRRI